MNVILLLETFIKIYNDIQTFDLYIYIYSVFQLLIPTTILLVMNFIFLCCNWLRMSTSYKENNEWMNKLSWGTGVLVIVSLSCIVIDMNSGILWRDILLLVQFVVSRLGCLAKEKIA